jgi:type IV pilus assembly protein PilM
LTVDDQSIWKKEISFRKKPKEQKAPAAPGEEQTSIWKKELSFGKKKEKKQDVVAAEPAREEPKKQSIWKKELSFGKKKPPQEESAPVEPVVESSEPEPTPEVVDVPPAVAAVLGRSVPEAAEPPTFTPEAEPVVEPVPETPPVWEAFDLPPAVAAVLSPGAPDAVEPPTFVPEVPPVVEPSVVVPEPEPAPEFRPPLTDALPLSEPQPLPPVDPEPAPTPPLPDPVELPLAPPAALEQPPPVDSEPEPFPTQPPIAPPVEVPAATSVPHLPPPVPEPIVVHPPVPAAQLPPEEKTESVPFWKRDISFGKKKQKPATLPPEEKTESIPFWKRDVSFGKKETEDAPKAKKTKPPKAPKVKIDRGGKGKKIVGLKIGASQLAAARVTNNGSAELLQVAREPLSPGVVVGGELRDPDALGLARKEFFAKHKLPKRGVRLGIANNRIGVRTFDVDGIDDAKQLDNAVRFRAQEALPIPIDEAVMDYQVLGESVKEDGQTSRRVLLVVAYREQIDRYMDACKKAGIILAGIDLEAFALLRALQAPQSGVGDDPDAALVAVAIGHERSTFAVSDGRVCEFTRVLEWGGAALNVALARTLDAAPSEVESVKRALSLLDEMTPEGLTSEQAAKARDAIRRSIQIFARELVSSLQFYQNQPGSLGIGEIVLTGGTTHLPGLAAELEKLIGVRVRVGDPLARIKVSKKLGEPEQVGSLAVAIGLGIED